MPIGRGSMNVVYKKMGKSNPQLTGPVKAMERLGDKVIKGGQTVLNAFNPNRKGPFKTRGGR